jgi:hypothetical protein
MAVMAYKPYDLETELHDSKYICDKVCESDTYAQNLYAALCNNEFVKNEVLSILKEEFWSCSWRYAGGIIADIRHDGQDYMDWYCSGSAEAYGFASEGCVTDEIREDLLKLGWIILDNK